MTDTKQTGILRSRWLWVGIFLAAYFASALWAGDVVLKNPLVALYFSPLAILRLLGFRNLFIPGPVGGAIFWGLHLLMWPFFAFFLWRVPYMNNTTFRVTAFVYVFIIMAALVGCALAFSNSK